MGNTIHLLIISIPYMVFIYLMRWRLNLLSMQDETAFPLISAPNMERLVVLLSAVTAAAVCVAKTGQIGWVGLIVLHITSRILGSDAQKVLPDAMLLEGLFVLICDNIS